MMKIGQPSDMPLAPPGGSGQPAARGGQANAPAGSAPTTQGASGVAVSVSAQARSIVGQDDGGAFDMAKVEAVRAAIAEGRFVVNAEAIADKLLANAREMLDRTRG